MENKTFIFDNVEITHINHASFRIKYDDLVIYIDPYQVKDEPADYILITHDHFDHFDPNSIELLKTPQTVFIVPEIMADKFTGNVHSLLPEESFGDGKISVYTIPMHNMHHPKQKDFLAFILEVDKKRIFHAGDSGPTDEMKMLLNIDVALMPIDGKYTMNEAEAADMVKEFKCTTAKFPEEATRSFLDG